MVRRALSFLSKEAKGLHQAAYLLAFFSILSQILAFLRDRLLAHMFGADQALDTYYAAFRLPDFIFVTVASIVSLSVLVPFIIEKEKEGKEAMKEFISNIFSFFFFLIFAACLIAFFLIPVFSSVLFKGFSGEALSEVILLSRILLISPIALGLSNMLGSLTQAYNRFFVYAIAPLLYNLGIIVGIIFIAPYYGVKGVAIGVAIGAILHALIQVPFVVKLGLMPRIRARFNFDSIKRVLALSLPRTLTLSTTHLGTIFLVSLASLMTAGSISIFSLAFNLQSVPLSIIGVSYSLAAFPTLSRYFASKNFDGFRNQIATTARHIIFWSLPVTALFVVMRAQIVRVLLGSGAFDWQDTRLAAAGLSIFIISAVFQSLSLLFIRGFYSAGYTKKPLVINLTSVLVLAMSALFFTKLFYAEKSFQYFVESLLRVQDIPGTVVLMLPLGFSVGMILNGILLWIYFEREFGGFSHLVKRCMFESIAASVFIGTGAYVGLNLFADIFKTNSALLLVLQGITGGVIGVAAGISALVLLKNNEIEEVGESLHRKLFKSKIIVTDSEIV